MEYNYCEEMKKDIENYLEENYETDDIITFDEVYDDMFINDSITGNASGSYTFSTYQAEENICHNMDLVWEAYREFGSTPDFENPEAMDVTVRCYLLGQVLAEVLEER